MRLQDSSKIAKEILDDQIRGRSLQNFAHVTLVLIIVAVQDPPPGKI